MVQLFKKVTGDASRLFKKAGETSNKLFKKNGSVENALRSAGSVAGSIGKRLREGADIVDTIAPLSPQAQMFSGALRSADAGAQGLKKVSKIATGGGNMLEKASRIKEEGNKINFA